MSYEIYRALKYNKATRCFDCSSYSNNVWPQTPSKWTMDYYAKQYPEATERELKALLILGGIYNGDRYYVEWAKEYQRIARVWLETLENEPDYQKIENARLLADFYDQYTAQNKKQFLLKNCWNKYIHKVSNTKYSYGECMDAKVFVARTADEIKYLPGMRWLIESAGFEPVELKG